MGEQQGASNQGGFANVRFLADAGLSFSLFPKRKVPLHMQMEAAECGLACLAMVGDHYGASTGIDALRAKFEVSSRGTSMQELMHIADQIGLNARSVALDLDEIQSLKLPAILYWDSAHWVVLTRVGAKNIQLNDPALGERDISLTEAKARFSGYALEITPRPKIVRAPPEPKLKYATLLGSFPSLGSTVLQLLGVSIILEIIALLTPYYTQIVMDHVLVTDDRDLLTIIALATGFLLFFQTIFTAIRGWAGVMLSQSVGYQLYAHVIRYLFRLPVSFFVKRQAGDLVARFDSLSQLAQSLTRTSIEIILDAFISIGTLIAMFFYSPTLAWIAVSVFALMLVVKVMVFSSSQRVVSERTFLFAKRQSHLIESLRGIHAIKMGRAEVLRAEQWTTQTKRIMGKDVATERITLFSNLVLTSTMGAAHILVVYFAAQMILSRQLSIGMLFAFMAYQGNFAGRASAFADRVMWLRTMRVHFGRVGDIVFAQPEPYADLNTNPNQPIASSLQVSRLGFRYSQSDPFVFREVSIDVQPKELVAIVGPSGTGKTSLLCVLGGIYLPAEGTLTLDGLRLSAQNRTMLRAHTAFVFQNDELFEGSIEENITFFDAQPDKTKVENCAAIACIAQDIAVLPLGYKTRLAEQGAGLSGGQRQRILLARAIYKNPSLLVLDEATSHLDVATEKRVLQNVKKLGITVIMSAHRPDAIALADRVYAIELKAWVTVNV